MSGHDEAHRNGHLPSQDSSGSIPAAHGGVAATTAVHIMPARISDSVKKGRVLDTWLSAAERIRVQASSAEHGLYLPSPTKYPQRELK